MPSIPSFIYFTLIVLPIITLASLAVGFYLVAQRASVSSTQRTSASIFVGVWLAAAWALARMGFFASRTGHVPNIAFSFIPLAISGILIALSPVLRKILAAAPRQWLIGVQVYRIAGALFLLLYAYRLLPGVFALPAGIGDVLVGLAAPVVAMLIVRQHPAARSAALIWNVLGMLDLTTAVALGVLSSPGFKVLPSNTPYHVIPFFPVVLIPAVIVPLFMLLHLISLNAELRSSHIAAADLTRPAVAMDQTDRR